MKFISILGLCGSGKGTLCNNIETNNSEIKCINVGKLLRDTNDQNIKKYLNNGLLVPSEITINLIKENIGNLNNLGTKCIILDGFPRSVENLEYFEKYIGKIEKIINLNIDESIAIERLFNRNDDSRTDDNIQTINNRINLYYKETKLVLGKFANKLVDINANKKPNIIYYQFMFIYNKL